MNSLNKYINFSEMALEYISTDFLLQFLELMKYLPGC